MAFAVLLSLAASSCGRTICGPAVYVPQERILVTEFRYTPFLNGRRCWVFLPRNYYHTSARYPVLYMLDGQELFDPNNRWRVDQTCESMIEKGEIDPIIVVGIENAHSERNLEYTPWVDSVYNDQSGRGEAFLQQVSGTLIPMVNRRFRTITGQAHTYIAGASLGGLMAA